MLVREITVPDAEPFMLLVQQVEEEASFMLMEPGERHMSVEGQKKQIESFREQENTTIFVAEEGNQLIGYVVIVGEKAKRVKHRAYLVIGVLQRYRGMGVGTYLFTEMEKWAMKKDICRLELTVVTENKAAIALYKKMGFQVEGTKRHSLHVQGKYYDEYMMGKLL